MAFTTVVIAANWYGPFKSIKEGGAEAEAAGVTEGLYLALNKCGEAYVGLSGDIKTRLNSGHHILGELGGGAADIWIGTIASQSVAGRGAGAYAHSLPVVIAERALAYFLELSENTRLRANPPRESFILINRWFAKRDPYDRRRKRGHENWPDLM